MTLREKVFGNPNGMQFAFAVVVSGLPYLWDDGHADWGVGIADSLDLRVKSGGLASKPNGFSMQSNPLEPLKTGSGVTIKLRDDGTHYLADLFAVANYGTVNTRLTADETSNAMNEQWGVESTVGIDPTTTQELYCGLETVVPFSVDSGVLVTVDRGRRGSKRHPHIGTQATTANQYTGARVTSSPRIFKGRFVSLLMAQVNEGGYVDSYDVVWQGLLSKVDDEGTFISLACDPLSDQIEKVEWPVQLAKGTAHGGDANRIRLRANDVDQWYLDVLITNVDDPTVKARTFIKLYSGNTAVTIPGSNTFYPVTTVIGWIRDTIVQAVQLALASASVPGVATDFEPNRFTITSDVVEGYLRFYYTNKTRFEIDLRSDRGFMATHGTTLFPDFHSTLSALPGMSGRFEIDQIGAPCCAAFALGGALISAGDDSIRVDLDNPNNQFDTLSGWDGSSTLGYASITQGDEREIISFTTVTPDSATGKTVVLSGILRGRAGTKGVAWVSSAQKPEPVVIQQIVMLEAINETGFKPDVVLKVLLGSTGVGSGGSWDLLGWRYSPGLSPTQLDKDGISSRIALVGDVPEVKTFYIDTPGGGAKALEEYLKFCGIYLIAKRWRGSGSTAPDNFGISIDVVDAPLPSRYSEVCTDSDRSALETPKKQYNERLLVNLFKFVPKLTLLSDDAFEADTGNPYRKWDSLKAVSLYADDSINDYGVGQTLDIKQPTFMFERASQLSDVDTAREAAIYWAALSAARWFGALANGNYLLTVKVISPQGWRFQMGDRIRCRFKGVTSPNGDRDLDAVGKVVRCDPRFADGCVLDLRLSYTPSACELCPGATILGHTAGDDLVLSERFWSDPEDWGDVPIPQPNNENGATDCMWFDPAHHDGAGLRVTIWRANNWAGREERTVTTLNKSGSRITLDSPLGATLQTDITAGTIPVYMTYDGWTDGDMSALRKLFAYIAGLDYLLDGVEPAKEWA